MSKEHRCFRKDYENMFLTKFDYSEQICVITTAHIIIIRAIV